MQHFIVERSFSPPISDQELSAVAARMAPCLDLHDVRWIRSHMSEDRQRMLCEYEARDAESVRKVQHEAEASFDRVWTAHLMEP
ncbi:MAG: DUF4242 domain-containing protein [Sterolibacteriaceae bacterium]|nr:DUF4242 domain-containing protein [Sterolibacteriaceae bacterium]MBK9086326.1 DUF4242 domain-containing protein [Sterolibacteriaceae bacterium]